jgi:hypothetical protein
MVKAAIYIAGVAFLVSAAAVIADAMWGGSGKNRKEVAVQSCDTCDFCLAGICICGLSRYWGTERRQNDCCDHWKPEEPWDRG